MERLHGVVAPPGGRVHFSKIQVQLRLIPLHSNGGVAQLFRFTPLLFGARQHHTQVGHVVRIVFFQVHRAAHVRQGFVGVVVSQECKSGLEFAEGFRIHHRLTSFHRSAGRWAAGRLAVAGE